LKIIHCNGRELTVRDAPPPIFRLRANSVPIKLNGWRLMEDAEARLLLRELLDSKLYEVSK
jgi:hypothetical protein